MIGKKYSFHNLILIIKYDHAGENMKYNCRRTALFILTLLFIYPSTGSANLVKRTFCVWDPIGSNGPYANMMKGMKTKALKWGVDLKISAYTDESIAANDFKAGQCDAVAVTEISSRSLNSFTGSIGAVGAIPTLDELRIVLQTLAQPKAAKLMTNGAYEVAGILPTGPIYTFVNDRSIDSFEKFQGKKMATFDIDPVQIAVAQQIGASPVSSSLARFSGQFNNGSVDIAFAPATAYMPMELYKGVEAGGGVIQRPLLQSTLQVLIHHEKFPVGYGQKSREAFADMIDGAFELIKEVEMDIAEEHWITMGAEATTSMNELFRSSRIKLRGDGVYNAKTLRLMRKVRCKHNPSNAECAEKTE